MAKEKLWTMGNRVPSEFVTELEMARREIEKRRLETLTWQDIKPLMALVEQAVGKLLVLEDERESFARRLTIEGPSDQIEAEDIDVLCQDAMVGSLGYLSSDATKKGWPSTAVSQAFSAYAEYMMAVEQSMKSVNPFGDRHRAVDETEEVEIELRFGTYHRTVRTRR